MFLWIWQTTNVVFVCTLALITPDSAWGIDAGLYKVGSTDISNRLTNVILALNNNLRRTQLWCDVFTTMWCLPRHKVEGFASRNYAILR